MREDRQDALKFDLASLVGIKAPTAHYAVSQSQCHKQKDKGESIRRGKPESQGVGSQTNEKWHKGTPEEKSPGKIVYN